MSKTSFAPSSNITREQMVAILARYAEKFAPEKTGGSDELTAFADSASISSWAVNDMRWAVARKLMGGTTVGGKRYLNPQSNATRAEVAVILRQYCAL